MMIKKASYISLCFFSILLWGSCSSAKTTIAEINSDEDRPNILFIMSDDHTSQAWGIYGGVLSDYVKNDNIRRLADEGAMLKNAFCTNSICVPSRGTILTGQYSHQNDIYTLSDALHPDTNTIAQELQKAGYTTALVGKWHLKKEPSGFDYYSVLPGQGLYNNPRLKNKSNWEDGYKGGSVYEGFSSDVIADQSIDWLNNRDESKPFFLMTHFKATHEPFDYPERHSALNEDVDIPEPPTLLQFNKKSTGRSFSGQNLEILSTRWQNDEKNVGTDAKRYPGRAFDTVGMDSIKLRKKTYQKFIKDFIRCGASIDDNIGKLLDYLDENGLAENTVVIYTSDQGYFLGEHGFFDKRMIYEEALRMPFVIRYPKEIKQSTQVEEIILNNDFPALFADYAGIEKPAFIGGKSFRNILKGNRVDDWRSSMYYRYWLHLERRPAHFGVRTDRYKLAFFYGQPLDMSGAENKPTTPAWEFYDLQDDPTESMNAYGYERYEDIIKELKQELINLRTECGDTDSESDIMQSIIEENWSL